MGRIRLGLSQFAGRPLELDGVVYQSESETNQRNRAIARLLESYGRVEFNPLDVVDVYTKQCALRVTAGDLAVMGAGLSRMAVLTRAPENTWCRPRSAVTAGDPCGEQDSMNAPASGFSKSGFRANLELPAES